MFPIPLGLPNTGYFLSVLKVKHAEKDSQNHFFGTAYKHLCYLPEVYLCTLLEAKESVFRMVIHDNITISHEFLIH